MWHTGWFRFGKCYIKWGDSWIRIFTECKGTQSCSLSILRMWSWLPDMLSMDLDMFNTHLMSCCQKCNLRSMPGHSWTLPKSIHSHMRGILFQMNMSYRDLCIFGTHMKTESRMYQRDTPAYKISDTYKIQHRTAGHTWPTAGGKAEHTMCNLIQLCMFNICPQSK